MKKVLVVGLTCIDIKTVVDHFPIEDDDVRAVSQTWTTGGNAANTSCILVQHSDMEVFLLSGLSSRPEHGFVNIGLEKAGVNIDYCVRHDCLLPTSTCILNLKTSSRTILCSPNDFPTLKLKDFLQNIIVTEYDWIHFEGRDFPDVGEMIKHVIKVRASSGTQNGYLNMPILSAEMEKVKRMDELDKHVLTNVDVLFISKDIAQAKGYKAALETVKGIARSGSTQAKFIICPWGDKGAAGAQLVEKEWQFYECSAYCDDNIVDTLGAGDTFNAGVIFSLVHGMNCQDSIQYGCQLAGKKCTQIGFENLLT